MTDADRIAAFIDRCTAALQEQVKGGQVWNVVLPEPADDVEREALRLFLAELEQAVGMPPPQGSS